MKDAPLSHAAVDCPLGTVSLATLFFVFARIGAFTFGGGLAMLPLLEREVIQRRRWATTQEINDIYAMAQTVPGVIAINTATFIGKRQRGLPGAIAATAGVVMPSFLIILIIAAFFEQAVSQPVVLRVMQGIRAAAVGMIAAIAWRIWKRSCKTRVNWILAAAAACLALLPGNSVVWIILGAIAAGTLVFLKAKKQCSSTGN